MMRRRAVFFVNFSEFPDVKPAWEILFFSNKFATFVTYKAIGRGLAVIYRWKG